MKPAALREGPWSPSSRPRVLIMDDEPEVLRVLQRVFEGKPWDIQVVTCGSAAILQHEKRSYDLILVDKNLPDMDGIDVIRHIRAFDSRVRFIVITGYASIDSVVETANLDVDAYLEKPFRDVFEVVQAVEVALGTLVEETARQQFAHAYVVATTGPMPVTVGADGTLAPPLRIAVMGASPAQESLARDALQAAGDQVLFFETSRALLAANERPSLVVLCAGDLAAAIPDARERWPGVPIVVVSETLGLRVAKRLVSLKITAVVAGSIDSYAARRVFSRLIPTLRLLGKARKSA